MLDRSTPLDTQLMAYVQRVTAAYPELSIATARLHTAAGQFNDILIVNEALIFRFPRSPHIAATLAAETTLLTRLQGRLPLPIPNPIYHARDPQTGALQFMGYPMLPGQPLWRAAFDAIADDHVLDRLAAQLAGFLRALHTLPPAAIGGDVPVGDTLDTWADMLGQFQAQLYPFMRPDACEAVTRLFTTLLDDLRHNPAQPVLRHGDFGTGNILYDPQTLTITGIIDFGFAGLGDPALDVAALAASYGEAFVTRCAAVYPEMAKPLPRARLYRGTYALQQALYALRDGNQADFADGIAAYM
jgi:aminoglycoside 2''-phosphotransferase